MTVSDLRRASRLSRGRMRYASLQISNSSCITRWSPCTTEADAHRPRWRGGSTCEGAAPHETDLRRAFEKCQVPLEFFCGQEERSIAVADVLSRQGSKTSGDNNGSSASLRIVRGLKGHSMPWPNNRTLDAPGRKPWEDAFGLGTPDLVAGKTVHPVWGCCRRERRRECFSGLMSAGQFVRRAKPLSDSARHRCIAGSTIVWKSSV